MNDRSFQIYKYNGRAIPNVSPGTRYLEIPIQNELMFSQCDEGASLEEVPLSRIRLEKFRCSLHITNEFIEEHFHISLNPHNNEIERDFCLLGRIFETVCLSVNERLEREQPITGQYGTILDSCTLHVQNQIQTHSIVLLVDLSFWSVSHRLVDQIGKPLFERTVHHAVNSMQGGNYTGSNANGSPTLEEQLRQYNQINDASSRYMDGYFDSVKYKEDAEENAHELLKGMITKKQFELYKNENYVIIKGTKGRIYKVKKNEMISVSISGCKLTRRKQKSYRLCIEPRDRGTICPTDEVIAKIKLIQADETKLHKLANKFEDTSSFRGGDYRYPLDITGVINE